MINTAHSIKNRSSSETSIKSLSTHYLITYIIYNMLAKSLTKPMPRKPLKRLNSKWCHDLLHYLNSVPSKLRSIFSRRILLPSLL